MGLTDDYLKHQATENTPHIFGVVASPRCNPIWLAGGKIALVSICESVVAWNLKTGKIFIEFKSDGESPVSCIKIGDQFLAVGYVNGNVKIFSLENFSKNLRDNKIKILYPESTFNGHNAAITCLDFSDYSDEQLYLASGSIDTSVIIWDILTETGICKFSSHKSHITSLKFSKQNTWLMTSSVDSTIKFWDIQTKYCFYTLLSHKGEVRQFTIIEEDSNSILFVTGSNNSEIKFYKFVKTGDTQISISDLEFEVKNENYSVEMLGIVTRSMGDKVSNLIYNKGILACSGTSKNVDIWRILSKEERDKKLKRKISKAKKKNLEVPDCLNFEEKFETIQTVYASKPVRGLNIILKANHESITDIKLMISCKDNKLEFWQGPANKNSNFENLSKLSLPGHRHESKLVKLGGDDTAIATASRGEIKIWNRLSGNCIRTIKIDKISNEPGNKQAKIVKRIEAVPTSLIWGYDNKHVIVGLKSGGIQVYHTSSGKCTFENYEIHNNSIWAIENSKRLGKGKGITTGGMDKLVSFFDYDIDDIGHICLIHDKSVEMDDEVLCLDYGKKHLAIGLSDNTVKMVYSDSLKLFITLYGHTQPVTAVKFSKDSRLIVTVSGDRDIRLWGTDFGDCHKKLYAHDDTITSVNWVSNSHYFFTSSKDGSLKYWDADNNKGTLIQTVGWHGAKGVGDSIRAAQDIAAGKDQYISGRQPIYNMVVTKNGDNIITVGGDYAIRCWERTNTPFILSFEKTEASERENEYDLAQNIFYKGAAANSTRVDFQDEVALAMKQSPSSIKTAERLLDVLEQVDAVLSNGEKTGIYEANKNYSEREIDNAKMFLEFKGYKSREIDYVIDCVVQLPPIELDQAVLLLPENWITKLGIAFSKVLSKDSNYKSSTKILIGRATFILVKIHHKCLLAQGVLTNDLAESMRTFFQNEKKMYNWNLQGLNFVKRKIENLDKITEFSENKTKKKKKHKIGHGDLKAPVLSVI